MGERDKECPSQDRFSTAEEKVRMATSWEGVHISEAAPNGPARSPPAGSSCDRLAREQCPPQKPDKPCENPNYLPNVGKRGRRLHGSMQPIKTLHGGPHALRPGTPPAVSYLFFPKMGDLFKKVKMLAAVVVLTPCSTVRPQSKDHLQQ